MTFTVYENAVFHTLDPQNPTASALVAEEGRIRFLGSVGEAREFAPQARRIDLGGAHAMPGMADSHIHTAQLALRQAEVDLSPACSSSEAVALVAHRVAQLEPGDSTSWIFGGRWNHRGWQHAELPDRRELDAVTGSHPTALHHSDLHTYWLNSAALAYLGIDAATPDPVGGTIVRDASGAATGILLEAAGFNAGRALEEVTRDDLAKLLPSALRTLVRQGITSIHDIDGMDAWDAFSDLHERGELPLRVNKIMPVAVLDQIIEQGVRTGQGDPWLRRGGVKIFSDGSLSSGTCLMHAPYGHARSEGLAVTAPEELNRLVKRANHNGLSAAVHAIGDRAVSNALDAFELAAANRTSLPAASNRIEHVQHIARRDLPRLAASGALACMQPVVLHLGHRAGRLPAGRPRRPFLRLGQHPGRGRGGVLQLRRTGRGNQSLPRPPRRNHPPASQRLPGRGLAARGDPHPLPGPACRGDLAHPGHRGTTPQGHPGNRKTGGLHRRSTATRFPARPWNFTRLTH